METVGERMTPHPQVVRRDTPLADAARQMFRLGIRHLPLVGDQGELIGLVRDVDVFAHGGLVGVHEELWVPFTEASPTLCEEVAVPAEVVARQDEPLHALFGRLMASNQDVIVVIGEEGQPVGVLTEHDGVRLALAELPAGLTRDPSQRGELLCLRRDVPAQRALELLRAHQERYVLVTEPEGPLFGVLSYGDLLADGVAQRPELLAEDVVRAGRLIAVDAQAPLRAAAALMVRHKVGCVPVVDDAGQPLDRITRADVIRSLIRAREARG